MLDAKQLASIEATMEEEHKKDREALQRLKRFLPNVNGHSSGFRETTGQVKLPVHVLVPVVNDDDDAVTGTIIGKVESILMADPTEKWTVPRMLSFLRESGFQLEAQKPERTIGLVFRKLMKRGKVRLLKKGSGRIPNVYRAVVVGGPIEANLLEGFIK